MRARGGQDLLSEDCILHPASRVPLGQMCAVSFLVHQVAAYECGCTRIIGRFEELFHLRDLHQLAL